MAVFKSGDTTKRKYERLLLTMLEYLRNYSTDFMAESLRSQFEKDDSTIKSQLKTIEDSLVSVFEQGKNEGAIQRDISAEAMLNYIEMFRYYVVHNPDAAAQYDKNPELFHEMASLFLKALFS